MKRFTHIQFKINQYLYEEEFFKIKNNIVQKIHRQGVIWVPNSAPYVSEKIFDLQAAQ